MTYYKTAKSNNETRTWEKCNATTEASAKREATRDYEGRVAGGVVCIGVEESGFSIRTIAEKRNGKWVNL